MLIYRTGSGTVCGVILGSECRYGGQGVPVGE